MVISGDDRVRGRNAGAVAWHVAGGTSADHGNGGRRLESQEVCDICSTNSAEWRRCKLVCRVCGTMLMSCADL